MNRFNQNLAKLQSGHHVKLREYMNLINPDLDGTCPHCRFRVSDELMTLKHWLCDWVAHAAMRNAAMRNGTRETSEEIRMASHRDGYHICLGHLSAYTGNS